MSLQRERRIVEHLNAGRGISEILQREGLDTHNNGEREVRAIAKKMNIDIPRPARADADRPVPFGLPSEAVRLGWFLACAREHLSDEALTWRLGMTKAEQRLAMLQTPKHDWKVAQLNRLAELFGLNFSQLIAYAAIEKFEELMRLHQLIPKLWDEANKKRSAA